MIRDLFGIGANGDPDNFVTFVASLPIIWQLSIVEIMRAEPDLAECESVKYCVIQWLA